MRASVRATTAKRPRAAPSGRTAAPRPRPNSTRTSGTKNSSVLGNNGYFCSADAASNTGGSSITQQLVKSVYIAEKDRQKRSADRKLKEIIYALELTERYSKDQILGWYVNLQSLLCRTAVGFDRRNVACSRPAQSSAAAAASPSVKSTW